MMSMMNQGLEDVINRKQLTISAIYAGWWNADLYSAIFINYADINNKIGKISQITLARKDRKILNFAVKKFIEYLKEINKGW